MIVLASRFSLLACLILCLFGVATRVALSGHEAEGVSRAIASPPIEGSIPSADFCSCTPGLGPAVPPPGVTGPQAYGCASWYLPPDLVSISGRCARPGCEWDETQCIWWSPSAEEIKIECPEAGAYEVCGTSRWIGGGLISSSCSGLLSGNSHSTLNYTVA